MDMLKAVSHNFIDLWFEKGVAVDFNRFTQKVYIRTNGGSDKNIQLSKKDSKQFDDQVHSLNWSYSEGMPEEEYIGGLMNVIKNTLHYDI